MPPTILSDLTLIFVQIIKKIQQNPVMFPILFAKSAFVIFGSTTLNFRHFYWTSQRRFLVSLLNFKQKFDGPSWNILLLRIRFNVSVSIFYLSLQNPSHATA